MSDTVKTRTFKDSTFEGEIYTTLWEGLGLKTPEGDKCDVRGVRGRTFQAIGDYDGATLSILGSINGTDWWVLCDIEADDPIASLPSDVRYVKPSVGGATEGTKLTLIFQQRRLS